MLSILSLIFLLILIFNLALGEKPRAIVHIGPHKTSSTHIQIALTALDPLLVKENWYWPRNPDGSLIWVKDISHYGFGLFDFQSNQTMFTIINQFIQNSLKLNRNIILSTEEFDRLSSEQIKVLKNHLQGFNVSVVIVYRELLSLLVSTHFEMNRLDYAVDRWQTTSFTNYLTTIMDKLDSGIDYLGLIHRYSNEFNQKNVHIIDLAGTKSLKIDPTDIFLCNIMGILCDNKNYTIDPHSGSNSKFNLIPTRVYSYFNMFLLQQNNQKCHFCLLNRNTYVYFMNRYNLRLQTFPPPMNFTSYLTMLHPFSKHIDKLIRRKYESNIINGNPMAVEQDLSRVSIEELVEDVFVTDKTWNQWFHEELKYAIEQKVVCDCQ